MSLRTARAHGGEVNETDAVEWGDAFLTISPLLGALGNSVTGNSTVLKRRRMDVHSPDVLLTTH